jgi:two-component system, sensor histidine kinase and response regulator
MTEASQPTILIVDDIPKNIQLVGTILKSEGYRLRMAQTGAQALKAVEPRHGAVDLILLDIMMPGMDGYETCRRLKADPATREIPVIFLTARTDPEDIARGFALGAVDYVTKPFNASELLARVRTHLSLKEKTERLRRSRETIRRISEDRRELLHILCHDLANPFSAILSMIHLIQTEADFDRWRHLLISSAQNGLDVIDLVRRMRSLEERELVLSPVNLADTIAEARTLLQQRIAEKEIRVDATVDPELTVLAEPVSMVSSVLNNLLTNAIKFSPSGATVRLAAEAVTGTDGADGVVLTVADHGIGMPPELVDELFDLSRCRSRPGTCGEMGTGFGLHLVKKFVTAYGGTVAVDSREGPDNGGTTITVVLKAGVAGA